jgi:hypothetical protein
LEGKSKREVEKTIADICPEIIKKNEKQRYIGENRVQVTYVISERLHNKIEKLKRLRAHENKDFLVILEELIDKDIKLHDPLARRQTLRKKPTPPAELKTHSRYVRVEDETKVWQKANAQCEYIDPLTNKRCEATHYLELDHIMPFALGGPTTTENLRLLCSNHNKLEALKYFLSPKQISSLKPPFCLRRPKIGIEGGKTTPKEPLHGWIILALPRIRLSCDDHLCASTDGVI